MLYFLKQITQTKIPVLVNPSIYLEIKELQLRLLKKQLTTKFFNFGATKTLFPRKWWYHKKIIALNIYIGTNVLVYERWLVLKVRYTAGRANAFAIQYSHCLCMWVNNTVGYHISALVVPHIHGYLSMSNNTVGTIYQL